VSTYSEGTDTSAPMCTVTSDVYTTHDPVCTKGAHGHTLCTLRANKVDKVNPEEPGDEAH
jgi:hypothetical protein